MMLPVIVSIWFTEGKAARKPGDFDERDRSRCGDLMSVGS
jgi:hypothetical protein